MAQVSVFPSFGVPVLVVVRLVMKCRSCPTDDSGSDCAHRESPVSSRPPERGVLETSIPVNLSRFDVWFSCPFKEMRPRDDYICRASAGLACVTVFLRRRRIVAEGVASFAWGVNRSNVTRGRYHMIGELKLFIGCVSWLH